MKRLLQVSAGCLTMVFFIMFLPEFNKDVSTRASNFLIDYSFMQEKSLLNNRKSNFSTFAVLLPNDVSVDIGNKQQWSYVFQAVLTTAAWNRIGFNTIVTIIFDSNRMNHNAVRLAKLVLMQLDKMKVKIIYMHVSTIFGLRVSQIVRLFTSHLTPLDNNDFVITSDSDLWPLNYTSYHPKVNMTFLSSTTGIGDMKYQEKHITYFPMSCIGMTVEMWKVMFSMTLDHTLKPNMVVDSFDFPSLKKQGLYRNYYEFESLKHLYKNLEFMWGKDVYKTTWHGGPLWYLDQWYLSIGIYNYTKEHGIKNFQFNKKSSCVRVDRIHWEQDINSGKCRSDAHILQAEVWGDKQWKRLMLLITEIHKQPFIKYLEKFRIDFGKLYNETSSS